MINKHRTPAIDKKKLPTPIVTPQDDTQTNDSIAKIEKQNTSTENKSTKDTANEKPSKLLTPKDFVPKLGINEKMVRIFLRKHYPQTHEKNKPWSITPELGKLIEKDFKNQVKTKGVEKKLRIERDLSGRSESSSATKAESLNADLSEATEALKGQVK